MVKPSSPIPSGGKVLLVCTDFSDPSKVAFQRAVRELASEGDRVVVLHITKLASFSQRIRDWHETRFQDFKVVGEVLIRDRGDLSAIAT